MLASSFFHLILKVDLGGGTCAQEYWELENFKV